MTTTPILLSPAFLLLLLLLAVLCVNGASAFLSPEGVFPPTCDGCFCVPDDDGTNNGTCPTTQPDFQFNFTDQLKVMKWKNPITLECNPYYGEGHETCQLTDSEGNSVEGGFGPDAVCGILYDEADINANNCIGSYETKTFASIQELEEAGYALTHRGACGTCSSTQDLAVYIDTPNLQGAGQKCGLLALSNETAALECWQDVGFSPGCATTWLYDTVNTRINCLNPCLAYRNKPPNLNISMCPLNDCILCNEETNGPTFKRIAGRTRRGSGLLSYIIRNCSELGLELDPITPLDPCPFGFIENVVVQITTDEASASSTNSSTTSSSGGRGQFLHAAHSSSSFFLVLMIFGSLVGPAVVALII